MLIGITQPREFVMAVLAGTFIFLMFAIFIIIYIVIYLKKRARHTQELEKLKSQFKEEMLKSSLEIKQQLSNDISQEIHDNVGQLLSLARVQLNIMNEQAVFDRELVIDLKTIIGQAMTDLRDIARSLSSDRIIGIPIEDAIGTEADRITRSGLFTISVKKEGERRPINDQKKMILFRIIQESLQNIVKHAKARNVIILFSYFATEVRVEVRDDGVGFDHEAVMRQNTGLGLRNIVNRAALLGGSFAIDSRIDKGTTITLHIPHS